MLLKKNIIIPVTNGEFSDENVDEMDESVRSFTEKEEVGLVGDMDI